MKKILTFLYGLLMLSAEKAQGAEAMKKHYLRTYDNAIKYNDISVAINALHGYMAIDSGLIYKDTLSILYLQCQILSEFAHTGRRSI